MARFNTNVTENKVSNLAGGMSYKETPELELISILLTSFAGEQFYRSANQTFERLKELLTICDKEFAAKAAIYARTKFGMRSITHVMAGELAKYSAGTTWAKAFYDKIVYRPDDMMEIMAYYFSQNQEKKLPNALRKGFASAFDKFDAYSLAKYKGESKMVKLIDIVNLVHPIPTAKNAEALKALVNGELKNEGTWEAELSKAGQIAENEEEKNELKRDVWEKLITERKIGYFALLRNLRNILEQAPQMVEMACELLVDEKLIRKSLVMPFRFTTAYAEIEAMQKVEGKLAAMVLKALNKAVDLSLKNVPQFEGDTLVVLDVSGSMQGKPAEIGSLFAAILVKANKADFMTFSDNAKYHRVNTEDSTISIAKSMKFAAGGTNFHSIFKTASQFYERIIILSDMQGWIGNDTPAKDFEEYKKRTGANPYIYSFDLQGYGTLQLPQNKVFALAGFSDKIFHVMQLLESDKNALYEEIAKIEL
jgi:hypothetical protein